MTKEQEKTIIARLKKAQMRGEEQYPCPRCGQMTMKPVLHRNATSRTEDVYICPECGMAEALRKFLGGDEMPLSEWAIIEAFDRETFGGIMPIEAVVDALFPVKEAV